MDNSCEITTSGSRKESKKNNKIILLEKLVPHKVDLTRKILNWN